MGWIHEFTWLVHLHCKDENTKQSSVWTINIITVLQILFLDIVVGPIGDQVFHIHSRSLHHFLLPLKNITPAITLHPYSPQSLLSPIISVNLQTYFSISIWSGKHCCHTPFQEYHVPLFCSTSEPNFLKKLNIVNGSSIFLSNSSIKDSGLTTPLVQLLWVAGEFYIATSKYRIFINNVHIAEPFFLLKKNALLLVSCICSTLLDTPSSSSWLAALSH